MPVNELSGVRKRQLARDDILDAAERLLRADRSGAFSMRDLAAEAGVSFATPFNNFGNKTAIMQALSSRRIDEMAARFEAATPEGDAIDRTLAAVAIAVGVLLDEPDVNRAVIGFLGAPAASPGAVSAHSRALWSLALGDLAGLQPALFAIARAKLPGQLAMVFRGCLSFWVAGEIADNQLHDQARSSASVALVGFAAAGRRVALLRELAP